MVVELFFLYHSARALQVFDVKLDVELLLLNYKGIQMPAESLHHSSIKGFCIVSCTDDLVILIAGKCARDFLWRRHMVLGLDLDLNLLQRRRPFINIPHGASLIAS